MWRLFLSYGALLLVLLTHPTFAQVSGELNPGVATTVQLPTFGVAIDADGVLAAKTFVALDPKLIADRLAAARRHLGDNMLKKSPLRKISLVRLEAELTRQLAKGKPDDALRHLAGLTRVQYVFYFPEEQDIVLAGPAEGWIEDAAGRAIGITTGRPTIALDDLAAALRTFPPNSRERPFVGCTIDPGPQSLARLVAFQATIPRVVAQASRARVATEVQRGAAEALGMANVRVFGIPAKTHLAEVMIEADYRMKLIALGLEPPPIKMTTFFTALGAPKEMNLQRWWFTPDYRCVKVAADKLAMELIGQGVQLQTEDKAIGPDGRLFDSPTPSGPSAAYSQAFTKNYPKIAERSPVYAQLRNVVDLLVAAAFIRQQDYYGQAKWSPGALLEEKRFAIETFPMPKQAPCVVNTVWRGSRLLSPAGGGVSIVPTDALKEENLLRDKGEAVTKAQQTTQATRLALADSTWWWD